jgi:hypothetical protein
MHLDPGELGEIGELGRCDDLRRSLDFAPDAAGEEDEPLHDTLSERLPMRTISAPALIQDKMTWSERTASVMGILEIKFEQQVMTL